MATKAVAVLSARRKLEQLAAESEFRRVSRDKLYFLKTYWYIPAQVDNAGPGGVKFKLFPYQEEDFDILQTRKKVIFGKSRQLGLTTLAMADSAWELLFATGRYELLVVSRTDDDAVSNLGMIKHGMQWLPSWLKKRMPRQLDDSAKSLRLGFPDGRTVGAVSLPGTANRGAGRTATRVVLDEMALMESPEGVYKVLDPATTLSMASENPKAVFIIISTFRGSLNYFATLFKRAWKEKSKAQTDFHAIFHSARENRFMKPVGKTWEEMTDKEFRILWTKKRADYKEPHLFYQEYPLSLEQALAESGHRRFPYLPDSAACGPFPYAGMIVKDRKKYKLDLVDGDDPVEEWDLRPLRLIEETWDKSKPCFIAADPAGGGGNDYSVAYVGQWGEEYTDPTDPDGLRKVADKEVIAYFSSNRLDPVGFADELDRLGRFFSDNEGRAALLCVEHTGAQAGEVISRVRNNRYPESRLFVYEAMDRVSQRKATIGWPMDRFTKPEAVNALARCFTTWPYDPESGEDPRVHSTLVNIGPELRDELGNFIIEDKGKFVELKADGGGHDDHVMAVAMMCAIMERSVPDAKAEAAKAPAPAPLQDGSFIMMPGLDALLNPKPVSDEAANLRSDLDRIYSRIGA